MPTSTAMDSARSSCTSSSEASEEKRSAGSSESPSILPCESIAALSRTCGRLLLHQCMNSSICFSHSSCNRPSSTSTPSALSAAVPPPRTVGFGSAAPITTWVIPAHSSASVHGGVLPKWLHGSRVMYAVDPVVGMPLTSASAIAICSACNPPMWSCQPSAMMAPS
uniref:Uncharacterized protein n=1 Tax=uncultured marine group II/III euryarchaeote KM3_74_C08 TaxID=1456501 RepID=A0A075HMF1_9EURY|nr:hypothetical protein [uncultured marine group II/III euryarchaeote KM3_74_C08]